MTPREVAALHPGIYLLTYTNGRQDLAAVGEIIRGHFQDKRPPRWYASISTIIASDHATLVWTSWDGVVSAELVLDRSDIDGESFPELGEPKTTDYCMRCGDSPESATHHRPGVGSCWYVDPRMWWTHEISCRCEACKVHA